MDSVRSVRDDSVVLADDPSPGGLLADAGGLALWCVGAGLDGNVGWARCADGALAEQGALWQGCELDAGGVAVRFGLVDLPPGGSALQLGTAGRTAGGSAWTPRAAVDDHGDSGTGAASGVSGTSVRDGGVECGNGVGCVLGADRVRCRRRRGDDSDGGCGAGEQVRRAVRHVSQTCASSFAKMGWLKLDQVLPGGGLSHTYLRRN